MGGGKHEGRGGALIRTPAQRNGTSQRKKKPDNNESKDNEERIKAPQPARLFPLVLDNEAKTAALSFGGRRIWEKKKKRSRRRCGNTPLKPFVGGDVVLDVH